MRQRVVFSRDSEAQTLLRPGLITRHKSARGNGQAEAAIPALSVPPLTRVWK